MSEERIRELWRQVADYYEKAREEFNRGEYQKAWELAWGAVTGASKALCLRFLGREPSESTFKLVHEALAKAGVAKGEAVKLLYYFRGAREGHGMCVYGGRYDAEEHDPIILEEIPQYLRTIGGLLGMEASGLEVGISERENAGRRGEAEQALNELSRTIGELTVGLDKLTEICEELAQTLSAQKRKLGKMEQLAMGAGTEEKVSDKTTEKSEEILRSLSEEERKELCEYLKRLVDERVRELYASLKEQHETLPSPLESAEKVRILRIEEVVRRFPPEKLEEYKSFEPFKVFTVPAIKTTFQYKGKEYEAYSLASEGKEGVLAAIARELEKERAEQMFEWDAKKLDEIRGLEGKEIDLREVLAARERIRRLGGR
jgi:hypothetical protein